MTAGVRQVYEAQEALDHARYILREIDDDVFYSMPPARRDAEQARNHPDVVAQQATVTALEREVADQQAAVGGKVYRVTTDKLDYLAARIEKLNKRAAKLDVEPIALTITDEFDELVTFRINSFTGEKEEVVHTFRFVIVNGSAPQVPGFIMLAALDHTADQGADEAVAVRRVPLTWVAEDDTREALEAVDLTAYRHAANRCEHCGYVRQRNTTYVVYNRAEARALQVGSSCLADYTGSKDPHRIAQWAEWLVALDTDLTAGGDPDDEGFGGTGRIAIPTLTYLTHVAACIRTGGWKARWSYGERNYDNTADAAHANIRDAGKKDRRGNPLWVETTDADEAIATATLEWVRELADRDDLNDYLHNLATYGRADYLPEKGDGFLASAINAYRRETEKKIEREQQEKVGAEAAEVSEYLGEVKTRLKGLTFTVTFVRAFEGTYDTRYLTKGVTEDGNRVLWWGSYELDQGATYTGSWTIKALSEDSYLGGARTTELTRPAKLECIAEAPVEEADEPEAEPVEVEATPVEEPGLEATAYEQMSTISRSDWFSMDEPVRELILRMMNTTQREAFDKHLVEELEATA